MKKTIIFLLIILIPSLCIGEEFFTQGIRAYEKGEFKTALNLFEKEISQSEITGETAFNMGNCYYKLGEYGKAVLWYKKAQKYSFKSPDLKFNMDESYSSLKIKKNENRFWFDNIFFMNNFLPESLINYLTLGFQVLFLGFILIFSGKKFYGIKLITGFIFLFFFLNSIFNFVSYNFYKQGIILEDSKIHSAYSDKSSVLFTIKEGMRILVKKDKKGFYKIVTHKGEPGWVEKAKIGVI